MAARVGMGMGAAAGGVVAMAIVRDLFGGRRLVVMLSRLALVSGVAPVAAPLIGSALLTVDALARHLRRAVDLRRRHAGLRAHLHARDPAEGPPAGEGQHDRAAALPERAHATGSSSACSSSVGMTFSGLFSYLSASSFLFQQTYGFDPQQYGLLFAVNSLGLVLGVQSASRLAARFGPQWVMAYSTSVLRRRGDRAHRRRSAGPRDSGVRSSRSSSS